MSQPPVPFPPFPELPDDDPFRSLKMSREYVRAVASYVRPYQLLGASLVTPILVFVCACLLLGFEPALSWASDLVPLTFAVISVLVSVKKLRDEHQTVVIAFVLVVGFLGSLVMHFSRVHDQTEHHGEINDLKSRMNSVGNQNGQLLQAFLAKPVLTSQQAEMERRQNIEKALRGEYILSHDNISPGLLAGIEFPPADWMNKRLQELGEKWKVTERLTPPSNPSAPPPPPPAIDVTVLVGDDQAEHTSFTFDPSKPALWFERERACKLPFKCYPERDLKDKAVDLDIGDKGWARMFFSLYNTGGSNLIHPAVLINLGRGKNVLITRINQRRALTPDDRENSMVQFLPNETMDVVPFSKSGGPYDYGVDLTVGPLVSEFALSIKIYGDNLANHFVLVPVRVKRSTGEK